MFVSSEVVDTYQTFGFIFILYDFEFLKYYIFFQIIGDMEYLFIQKEH